MRRALRSSFSVALCAVFLVQTTGAADLGPALLARGAMLPPPGRMAPMPLPGSLKPAPPPAKARPAGETWLESAAVVARWIVERLAEAPSAPAAAEPVPEALEAFAAAARVEAVAVAAAPAPEPPADRMLIAMEGRRVLASGLAAQLASVLQYRSELKPMMPRFVGEWVGRGPVRARVDYMAPFGVTQGEAKGFRVRLSDGYERLLPSRGPIPNALMRELPLYFAGDSVDVEVTLLNTGKETLTGLRLSSVQEAFNPSGEAGAPVSAAVVKGADSLAPGASTVLRWRIRLSRAAPEAVNFEQTHLLVTSGDKVLLDQAQAGIVDPPGDG